jgi:ATP-dependent Lon protease
VYALFEALNPEQNSNFVDRFIEVPVDLSKVLFILTTSADMNIIFSQGHWEGRLGPLRNRMVMIEFSGYAAEEKIKIAKEHLIPKWQEKW